MSGSITNAIDRWKQGDPGAQFDLEARLQPFLLELLAVVRRRRRKDLRAVIDSEAVVNEGLCRFLAGARDGDFPTLENRENVRRLLSTLVRRVLLDEVRLNTRQKRDRSREQPLAEGAAHGLADPRAPAAEATALLDWVDEFQNALRDRGETAMKVVELTFKGLSVADIAQQVGLGERSVQLLRKKMADCLPGPGADVA